MSAVGALIETMPTSPLARSTDERMLAGVCGGLAEHLGLPVMAVRVAMLLFALLGGAGLLFYIWLWVLVPPAHDDMVAPMRSVLTRPSGESGARAGTMAGAGAGVGVGARGGARPLGGARSRPDSSVAAPASARAKDHAEATGQKPSGTPWHWPVAEFLLGGALLVVGISLVVAQMGGKLRLELILPAMAVLVGVGLTWWQIADRNRPERHQLPRVLGALALVAVGVLMFFVTAQQPSAITVIAAALAVLAGVALALAPWALRLNRDLVAERAARAREVERAEIAAHLHDSVLQTLAAIQQRSEPGSDAARLARGQERELREWLFRAADGAPAALREAVEVELRAHAAALEADHAVRFEVVAVGTGSSLRAPEPLTAAAREAMLNAAQHAGGEVTVYVEATPSEIQIDVTDRGAGLDLTQLPEGRMGVRESIIGRMERAGGRARIVPGPGGTGTSVRLSAPLPPHEGDTDDGA